MDVVITERCSLKCKDCANLMQYYEKPQNSDLERNNPPKIGDVVTFKYKELTKYGKPRFPVFFRIREGK